MLCTIKIIAGFTLGSPGDGSPHRLWAYDPPYSVAHYDLDHGKCTPQAWHGYQGPLKIGWNNLCVLWHIPPVGAGGFHCPQSLARCHGAGGAHPSTRLLGYQRNPLGLMELLEFLDYAVGTISHCLWWRTVKCCCFPLLSPDIPDKGWDPEVNTLDQVQAVIFILDALAKK